jgi:hypothetical protein
MAIPDIGGMQVGSLWDMGEKRMRLVISINKPPCRRCARENIS